MKTVKTMYNKISLKYVGVNFHFQVFIIISLNLNQCEKKKNLKWISITSLVQIKI